MAILKNDKFEVKVSFTDYKYGWVYYQFEYLYDGKPIFDYQVYPKECLQAEEYHCDSFISRLEGAENENTNALWETDEPLLRIEIRFSAKMGWKEAQTYKNLYVRSDSEKARLAEVDKLREESGGKLDDDGFELAFLIGYWMNSAGPAFFITVSRKELKGLFPS